ncbi:MULTISPECIES: hypothetical protein [Ruegeria]|uniref:hypothetical protein n=1 Tax=Ruegeria TaxID=97050 RepID=UPI00147BD926|nr:MULTISPECIES: hypothetical protein [Ruegeria]UUV08269.1 hypothetical protein NOR97_17045 [Ruegeria sp. YS9]
MSTKKRPERAEIVIHAWFENGEDDDKALRGSISSLNGSHKCFYIGMSQLIEKMTSHLRSLLGKEAHRGPK